MTTLIAAASESRRKWLALTVIVAAQFMVVLDIAIVNVALPAIKGDLGFAQENLQWVISAYAILFGGVLLLGGRLADVFGRRRVFMLGLAIFSLQLAALRVRLVGGLADRLPRPPGPGRRAVRTRRPLDPDDHLRRGRRAQPRAGHLGRGLGQRRRGRRAARRLSDLVPELVVGLLHQRPGRARGDRRGADRPAREPRPGAPPLRRGRRGLGHGRRDAAGLRDDPRHPGGLGQRRHRRPARHLRGADRRLRRDRVPLAGPAAADADLPQPLADGRQLGRRRDRRDRVLRVLPADPLHAAGARLLRDRDRRGLRRDHLLGDRVLERRTAAGHPAGRAQRADRGPRPGRRRPGRLHPAAGGRALLLGSLPGVPDHRHRPRASRSSP